MELAAGLRVEPRGGLVEEEQLGPADDADGDVEPPPLTAGQRGDLAVGEVRQADRLQEQVDVVRRGCARAWSRARSSRPAGSAAGAGSTAGGRARTGGPRRCGPASPRRPRGSCAQHGDLAGGADPEALEDLDRRRLARAVRPEQADAPRRRAMSKSTPVSTSLSP